MNKNALSIFNQLRPVSVGFDNMFDHFEKMFEDDFFNTPTVNYPPYNIVKTGENKYDVEVALAGYSKKDINIEYADNLLTIKSVKDNNTLKKDFNIVKPRLIISGLNPHSGENGQIGKEEINFIIPVIKKLKRKGINIYGPYSADSMLIKNNLK